MERIPCLVVVAVIIYVLFSGIEFKSFNVALAEGEPVANAGPDQSVNELTQVTLDGSTSSSPTGAPLVTYQWVQVDSNPLVTMAGNGTAVASFQLPDVPAPTTYAFNLIVTDANGLISSPDNIQVNVNDLSNGSALPPSQPQSPSDMAVNPTGPQNTPTATEETSPSAGAPIANLNQSPTEEQNIGAPSEIQLICDDGTNADSNGKCQDGSVPHEGNGPITGTSSGGELENKSGTEVQNLNQPGQTQGVPSEAPNMSEIPNASEPTTPTEIPNASEPTTPTEIPNASEPSKPAENVVCPESPSFNMINGNASDNQIVGTRCNDQINGAGGNDQLDGAIGDDLISGDVGNDILHGGEGNDQVNGVDGDDTLYGGPGDDKLVGGAGANFADGEDGNDEVTGGANDDQLQGGEGDDVLNGGSGNDRLDGGGGNDVLNGGAGDDILTGGPGSDQFSCGDGIDAVEDFNPAEDQTPNSDCEVV